MLLHVDVLRRLREQTVHAQTTLERLGQNGRPVPLEFLPVARSRCECAWRRRYVQLQRAARLWREVGAGYIAARPVAGWLVGRIYKLQVGFYRADANPLIVMDL